MNIMNVKRNITVGRAEYMLHKYFVKRLWAKIGFNNNLITILSHRHAG